MPKWLPPVRLGALAGPVFVALALLATTATAFHHQGPAAPPQNARQINHRPARERKEGRHARQWETKAGLLLWRLRIRLLVFRGVGHRHRRTIVS